MTYSEKVEEKLAAVSQASSTSGVVTGYDWVNSLVLVNVGGNVLSLPWASSSPWMGDRVRVVTAGGNRFAVPVLGSAMGTVDIVDANVAVVNGDDGFPYSYVVADGVVLTVGDRVRLDHAGRAVTFRYPVEPAGSPFDVPVPPPAMSGSGTFVPTQSGSWKSGVYRGPDVEVNGDGRSGYYWYGTQIADTIPAGSTITRAELRLTELYDYFPGTAAPLGTHTQAAVGGSAPALSGSVAVTDGPVVDILSIAGNFLSGALGVGFADGAGQRAFAGAPASGSIYLEWRA